MKTYTTNELSSGMMMDRNHIRRLKQVVIGKALVTDGKKTYRVVDVHDGYHLQEGAVYLCSYKAFNQGATIDRFLKYVKGERNENRMLIEPLCMADLDVGDYYYEFEGKYCRGSGAEPLAFCLLEEVEGGAK